MAAKDDSPIDMAALMKASALQRGLPWPPPSDPLPIRPRPATATIYFLGPDDGPIKIGFASRVEVRLRGLRLANAFPLQLWATVQGPLTLEREYHRRFAAHRLHGEWFTRCPEIEAEIARLNAERIADHA
jgi:hypothetical protein